MTPKSVLAAGRKERERYEIAGSLHRDRGFDPPYGPWGVVELGCDPAVIHLRDCGTRTDCQDFIDDRVFRAMLRALARVIENEGVDPDIFSCIKAALLALAGGDHD